MPEALAGGLRSSDPPVVGRMHEGRVWMDARTLLPGDAEDVVGGREGRRWVRRPKAG